MTGVLCAALLAAAGGEVRLPAGVCELREEIVLRGKAGLRLTGTSQSVLRAAPGFRGRALLVIEGPRDVTVSGLRFEGAREVNETRHGFPSYSQTFAQFQRNSGLLVLGGERMTVRRSEFTGIAGYAVLVSGTRGVVLEGLSVRDSGSRAESGKNNASGGVLLEDGTADFRVENCRFTRVLGNGVWTHSRMEAPRNGPGVIRGNVFEEIGRDALQAGHATSVVIELNRGTRIGYPEETVDLAGGAIPVGVDTAGIVDASLYRANVFTEINGKCLDLDGFRDGRVVDNVCINRKAPEAYPAGQVAIVFNNSNPRMRSENVRVVGNRIEGFKFGGLFLLGTGHHILRNRFLRINTAGCPESHARFGCLYLAGQPDILSSGIYLAVNGGGTSRDERAWGNVIRENEIQGPGMTKRCIVAAPGVKLEDNILRENRCRE